MSSLDAALEYDALRSFAKNLGFFAQIHRNFDSMRQAPGREAACWYLQRSKKFHGEGAPHEPTILKFKTAEEIYAWLNEFKRTESSR